MFPIETDRGAYAVQLVRDVRRMEAPDWDTLLGALCDVGQMAQVANGLFVRELQPYLFLSDEAALVSLCFRCQAYLAVTDAQDPSGELSKIREEIGASRGVRGLSAADLSALRKGVRAAEWWAKPFGSLAAARAEVEGAWKICTPDDFQAVGSLFDAIEKGPSDSAKFAAVVIQAYRSLAASCLSR